MARKRRNSYTNSNKGSSRKNKRNRRHIAEIKALLRRENFDRVYMLRDEDIENTLEFPSKKDIEIVLKMTREGRFRETPYTLKRLEEYGLVIPYDVKSAIEVKGKQYQRRKDPMSVLQEYEYSEAERVTLKGYFDIAKEGGNPDEIMTNSGIRKVSDLRQELYDALIAEGIPNGEGYHSIYMGDRFTREFDEISKEILNDFTNNQIIALYGLYDSGNFLSNIQDYDSNNDGVNIKGLYTLKQHIAMAKSF